MIGSAWEGEPSLKTALARRAFLKSIATAPLAGMSIAALASNLANAQDKEVLPKHITPETFERWSRGSTIYPPSRPTTARGPSAAAKPIRWR